MANRVPNHGIYARLISDYARHKRSLGYKMEEVEERLRRFDQLTIDRGEKEIGISKELADEWCRPLPMESESNRYGRISILRGFSSYLQVIGYASYVPRLPKDRVISFLSWLEKGRRDFVLLGLLYDSGCRVQELIDLTPSCFRFDDTTNVRLLGKGNKARIVPLSETQVANLRQYMAEEGLMEPECQCHPLFPNPQGTKMSRMAVLNIVKKYQNMARAVSPELIPETIGCHSFRHSKAMHMLEAEINLVYIRDFLGHVSTTTTEVYARASEKMKQKALSKLNPGIVQEGKTSWQNNKELLSYLKSLQTKH